jgi:hypothetical protein
MEELKKYNARRKFKAAVRTVGYEIFAYEITAERSMINFQSTK